MDPCNEVLSTIVRTSLDDIKESASQMGYSVIQYGHGQILAWAAVIYNKKENSLPAKHNNFLEIFHVIGVFFLIGIAGLGS